MRTVRSRLPPRKRTSFPPRYRLPCALTGILASVLLDASTGPAWAQSPGQESAPVPGATAERSTTEGQEWLLAGPCARAPNEQMWAFLKAFPGKLSHHDGKEWHHIDLRAKGIPQQMTCDNEGRLQIGFSTYSPGSCLIDKGTNITWFETPLMAWTESVRAGATAISDGSPFRPQHVLGGRTDWLWASDGHSLWEGNREYDYDAPAYRYYWTGTNGICYRATQERVWIFAAGRWSETPPPPLTIGPDGIRACSAPGRLPVTYDGALKIPLHGLADGPHALHTPSPPLQGNEAFLPAATGGWLGQHRVVRDACYRVPDRIYPGSNGHYLITNRVLRYQPPQTLTITGEVTATGKAYRLECRIASPIPLYKPRILTFIDNDFIDSLKEPTGGSLPPLSPGNHTIEVFAADGFGVVGDTPLRMTINGAVAERFTLDDTWSLNPQRLQAIPLTVAGRSLQGKTFEIDSDGVFWILIEGGIVSIDQANRQAVFHWFPARGLLPARGRVWTYCNFNRTLMNSPLYELRRDGPQHAVDLNGTPSAADPSGGIWVLTGTLATRWDGQHTQHWERNFDATQVIPHPEGIVIHSLVEGICHAYRNGELGAPISGLRTPQGHYRTEGMPTTAWTLGRSHLVVLPTTEVVNLDSGQAIDMKFPYGVFSRRDSCGNLYYWDKGQFFRISGADLSQTTLGPARRPMSQSEWGESGGWYDEFLATTNGDIIYSAGPDRLVTLESGKEAVEYDLQQGLLPGRTHAIRRAPDGRIWMLRSEQLVIYDPRQTPDSRPPAWSGWRTFPIANTIFVGAMDRFWYVPGNRPWLTCTDGTNETKWSLGVSGDVIIGDQGCGVVFSGNDTYNITPDLKFTRGIDRESAILELVKSGTKRFEGDAPPIVAADGRVYFRGKLWGGKEWLRLPEGRPSLSKSGELHLLCQPTTEPPTAYRIDGTNATALGKAQLCLIDADGLRWYDTSLMDANPGCLPVWHAGDGTPRVSSTTNSKQAALKPNTRLQAFRLDDGQFLLRIDSELHILGTNGLSPLPSNRLPFPGSVRKVCRLANDRWVFVSTGGTAFISPPNARLSP